MFRRNRMKYSLPSDKGRTVECRCCTVNRFVKQQGEVVKYNFEIRKFQVIKQEVNIKNILKEF